MFGLVAILGCGTTRMTDTTRALSEMKLVSQAIDDAMKKMDFSALHGKTVFLDNQYLEGIVDRGYLISSLRQELMTQGCLIQDERTKAEYIVEARAGGVGTDKHSLLVGTPALSLPALVPGVPTAIPEIALVKKTDQQGGAKIAVFAYSRLTGQGIGEPVLVEAGSNLKDTWFFGAGPYRRGSIQRDSEFAGEKLPKFPNLPTLSPETPEEHRAEPARPVSDPAKLANYLHRDRPPMLGPRGFSAIRTTRPEISPKGLPSVEIPQLPELRTPKQTDNERP
ncbi:MAG: DUF6655 family protein [Fimbriiglobus sp.]